MIRKFGKIIDVCLLTSGWPIPVSENYHVSKERGNAYLRLTPPKADDFGWINTPAKVPHFGKSKQNYAVRADPRIDFGVYDGPNHDAIFTSHITTSVVYS